MQTASYPHSHRPYDECCAPIQALLRAVEMTVGGQLVDKGCAFAHYLSTDLG